MVVFAIYVLLASAGALGFAVGHRFGWRAGRATGRTEACREIGTARKIFADRLKAAAQTVRDAADDLWPAAWCDEQPPEPKGYE